MNERIEALKKLATKEVWGNNPYNGAPEFDGYELDADKFAELIVRECCSKLVEMGEGWHEFARNPPKGQEHNASGALFAAYRLKEDAVGEIKEHFGVEE